MRTAIRSTLARLFSRKAVPSAPAGMSPYTVVLDWDGDNGSCDAPVIHVWAENTLTAVDRALEGAWDEYAGCIDEIPEDAEYDEAAAEDLWYSVAVLAGHAPSARG